MSLASESKSQCRQLWQLWFVLLFPWTPGIWSLLIYQHLSGYEMTFSPGGICWSAPSTSVYKKVIEEKSKCAWLTLKVLVSVTASDKRHDSWMSMKSERSPKKIHLAGSQGFISWKEFLVLIIIIIKDGALKYLVIEIKAIYGFITLCAFITHNCVLSATARRVVSLRLYPELFIYAWFMIAPAISPN